MKIRSKNKLVGDFSPNTEGNGENIDDLVVMAKEPGHVDLYRLSPEQISKLADWYRSDFESLNEDDKIEFLEQFMMTDEFKDEESAKYIRQMDPQAKGEIGLFVYNILMGEKFIHTFHECWNEIDPTKIYEIKNDIVHNHPERALMIAPFFFLGGLSKTEKSINRVMGRLSPSRKTDTAPDLQQEQFSDFDKSTQLVETIIEYAKNHPGEYRGVIVQNLLNVESSLLIPYINQLESLDLLDKNQIDTIIASPQNYFSLDKFNTSIEREERNALLKDLEKYYPEEDRGSLKYYPPVEMKPRKIGVKLAEIKDKAYLRVSESVLGKFSEYSDRLEIGKIEYLVDLVEAGVPVFAQIDSLGLSNEEISRLFKKCIDESSFPFGVMENFKDMKKFVEYSRSHTSESGPNLEQILVHHIINDIQENGVDTIVCNRLGLYTDDFFATFDHNDQQRITDAISRFAPGLWLSDLSYAISHEVMSLDELIDKTSTDAGNFISNYDKILYHLRLLEREGKELNISPEMLSQKAKDIFTSNPDLFILVGNKGIVDRIYTLEEQYQFIDEQLLGNIDPNFFASLFGSRFEDKYLDKCREFLWDNDYLFSAVTEHYSDWGYLKKVVDYKYLLDLSLRHIEAANFEVIFDDHLFIAELGANPVQADALIDKLLECKNFTALVLLNEKSADFQDREQKLQDRLKSLNRFRSNTDNQVSDSQKQEMASAKAELSQMGGDKYIRIKDNLVSVQEKTLEILDEACEQNRFLIFSRDMMDVNGLDVAKYIARDLPGYLVIDSQFLFKVDHRHDKGDHKMLCENIFGSDKFNLLINDNKRILAFKKNEYGYQIQSTLSPDVLNEIHAMNPLIELSERDKLTKDYYYTVLDEINKTPFAGLYIKQLEKIAHERNEADGPTLNTKRYFEPDKKFQELAKRIFLLNSHPAIVEHADWIMALPEKQQSELIGLLEFALLNNFLFLKQILEGENFEEIKKNLQEDIENFVLYVFDIEEMEGLSFEDLSPETIRALIIYYHQTCKKNNRRDLIFKDFIGHVLNGTYRSWRNWGTEAEPEDKSLHLKQLKENKLLPSGLNVEQYEEWMKEDKLDFEEAFDYKTSDMKYNIREIIETALVDEHIDSESLDTSNIDNRYDNLIEPLRLLSDRQKELKELLKNEGLNEDQKVEYKQLSKKIAEYREEYGEKIDAILALKYLEKLKNLSAHDLESQTITIDGKTQVSLKKVFNLLRDNFGEKFPNFISDINRIHQVIANGFEQIYGGQKISKEKIHLTDKIDLETYTFIGEKPVNSCQHYNGLSDLNAGLLSYLTDPNVKIIQMYNESGNIIARSVVRLVEDDKGDPQLFIERIYSTSPHPKINEAIINFAKSKAGNMGVKLYTSQLHVSGEVKENEESRVADLHNHGSRSTHVYTDAGGGKMPNGRFTIRKAKPVAA